MHVQNILDFRDESLDPNTLYWYAIEAQGECAAPAMASAIRAARYTTLGDEPEHPIGQVPLSIEVIDPYSNGRNG